MANQFLTTMGPIRAELPSVRPCRRKWSSPGPSVALASVTGDTDGFAIGLSTLEMALLQALTKLATAACDGRGARSALLEGRAYTLCASDSTYCIVRRDVRIAPPASLYRNYGNLNTAAELQRAPALER